MKTIKITADNKISIVDVDFSNNRAIMDAMGGPVEVVTTNELYDFFKCPVLMMLDKNGYKPKDVNGFCPSANAVASFVRLCQNWYTSFRRCYFGATGRGAHRKFRGCWRIGRKDADVNAAF